MSSPTINIGGSSGSGSYPSFEEIMNLVRGIVNDSQAGVNGIPGEGQVITDSPSISPFTLQFMNSAIRQVFRELRNIGAATLIKDNVIISGLTPVNGANGAGIADPAVQTFLSYGGYFDGNTINNNLVLPSDLLYPETVWERQTGSNNTFAKLEQPQDGLPSRPQYPTLAQWEWREDKIWFVGSTQVTDVRLRYYCALPQYFSSTLDFSSTYVPVLDAGDAIAYKIGVLYARMLGSPGLPDLIGEAKEQMFQIKNAYTRRMQSQDFHRVSYGHSDGDTNQLFFLR